MTASEISYSILNVLINTYLRCENILCSLSLPSHWDRRSHWHCRILSNKSIGSDGTLERLDCLPMMSISPHQTRMLDCGWLCFQLCSMHYSVVSRADVTILSEESGTLEPDSSYVWFWKPSSIPCIRTLINCITSFYSRQLHSSTP